MVEVDYYNETVYRVSNEKMIKIFCSSAKVTTRAKRGWYSFTRTRNSFIFGTIFFISAMKKSTYANYKINFGNLYTDRKYNFTH